MFRCFCFLVDELSSLRKHIFTIGCPKKLQAPTKLIVLENAKNITHKPFYNKSCNSHQISAPPIGQDS